MAPEEYAIDARAFADALREQRAMKLKGGLYHLNQIQMAYNTNRIEGSRLTEEQTRYLYETRTVMGDALVDNAIGSLLAATPSKMTSRTSATSTTGSS